MEFFCFFWEMWKMFVDTLVYLTYLAWIYMDGIDFNKFRCHWTRNRMCLKGVNADHKVTSMGSTTEYIYSIIWNKVLVVIKCFSLLLFMQYSCIIIIYISLLDWKIFRHNRNIQYIFKTTPVLMFWYISPQLACMAYFPEVYLIACLHDFLNLVELR